MYHQAKEYECIQGETIGLWFIQYFKQKNEYSGRFYTACPVMETVDSGMMETAIPEMQNQ